MPADFHRGWPYDPLHRSPADDIANYNICANAQHSAILTIMAKSQKKSMVKISAYIPPDAHRELRLKSAASGKSLTSLIAELIGKRFQPGNRKQLETLAPEDANYSTWIRASVFVPADLLKRATAEVLRQELPYGTRLSSVIAALVAAEYPAKEKDRAA